jgi:hypothetical protein
VCVRKAAAKKRKEKQQHSNIPTFVSDNESGRKSPGELAKMEGKQMESRQSSMTTTVGDKKEGGRDRLHIARRLVIVMWRQVLVHRDVPKVGRD